MIVFLDINSGSIVVVKRADAVEVVSVALLSLSLRRRVFIALSGQGILKLFLKFSKLARNESI